MRLVNFNIEWMNDWFVGGNKVAFRQNNPGRGIDDVDQLARRVAGLILDTDTDVLSVEEGPSDKRKMQLFVSTYLSDHGADLFDVLGCEGAPPRPSAIKLNLPLTQRIRWKRKATGEHFRV